MRGFDWFLVLLIILIVIFSNIILISIGAFRFPYDFIYLILAFFSFFLFSKIDYLFYKNFTFVFYFLSLFFLSLTFLFGRSIKGASRWLDLGFVSFQTSELIKPWLIVSFSSLVGRFDLKKAKEAILFFLFFLPVFLLIFKQPDLGNTIVYFLLFLTVFYLNGVKLSFFFFGFLLLVLAFPLFWQVLKEYQKQRLMSFLNPSVDPLGINYNLIQAIMTIGSGWFLGRGLGVGVQSKLRFLPERATDFIFASLAEEVGFLGSLILIILFFFLLLRLLILAWSLKDQFAKNITLLIFMMIFSQVMINIGMNLGLMPITGITLPLVSQGGSSFLATMISLGIVNNIVSRKEN